MSKILLIEDDETMRDGMSQVLKRAGHEVIGVFNGADGIQSFSKEKFDLVITDFKMEGMDGMEVLEKVKSIDEYIEVLMVTAYGSIDMAVEAMRKGAFDYMNKPFEFDELCVNINRAMENKKLHEQVKFEQTQVDRRVEPQAALPHCRGFC